MKTDLRPMNLGEILDRTFQIYRVKFLLFVALAALPALVMMGLQIANQFWWKLLPEPFGKRIFLWFTPQNLFYGLVLAHGRVFFNLFLWPGYAFITSKAMFGEQVSLSGSISACLAKWKRWVGLAAANWSLQLLLPELVIAGLLIGTVLLMFEVFKMDPNDPLHLGPLMFVASLGIGWVVFQWIGAAISMSAPASVIEDMRIRVAIRRGRMLSKDSRWRLFFARTMPTCIGWILSGALATILFLLVLWVMRSFGGWRYYYRNISTAIGLLSEAVASTLIGPIYPIALTLFYYDQRIRKEGYDIERMMEDAGMNASVTTPVEAKVVQV